MTENVKHALPSSGHGIMDEACGSTKRGHATSGGSAHGTFGMPVPSAGQPSNEGKRNPMGPRVRQQIRRLSQTTIAHSNSRELNLSSHAGLRRDAQVSSKPVRSCSPRLGRFDSGAAPLSQIWPVTAECGSRRELVRGASISAQVRLSPLETGCDYRATVAGTCFSRHMRYPSWCRLTRFARRPARGVHFPGSTAWMT